MATEDRTATLQELAAMNSWADQTVAALEAQVGAELLHERLSTLGEFSAKTFPKLVQTYIACQKTQC